MDNYIEKWITIIDQMRNNNTYKLAWGRGIIESILMEEYYQCGDDIIIHHKVIVEKMIKYYWNQTFFFSLQQGPNRHKPPVFVTKVNELIEEYKQKTSCTYPVWYTVAETSFKVDMNGYLKRINQLVSTANQTVSFRFLNHHNGISDIYLLDKKKKTITISKENMEALKDYGHVLIQLLNYKWAQLLEQFNTAPRIASKVKNSNTREIKRNNLRQYKELLLKQYKDGNVYDFYTGKILDDNDISIDHVIPWSFMYSDDIWNLVITSKSYNSKKSNHLPNKDDIKRLKERNEKLITILDNKKFIDELHSSIDNNYVDKFYINCVG